jgi:hypothetical protein
VVARSTGLWIGGLERDSISKDDGEHAALLSAEQEDDSDDARDE